MTLALALEYIGALLGASGALFVTSSQASYRMAAFSLWVISNAALICLFAMEDHYAIFAMQWWYFFTAVGGFFNNWQMHRAEPSLIAARLQMRQEAITKSDLLSKANSLLRSAYAIAERDGKETNWEAIRNQLKTHLDAAHAAGVRPYP
ncbi:MAG: hypothetical protein WC869_00650 [Phycisphaerae bacterium]|jgi:hypothetical protein